MTSDQLFEQLKHPNPNMQSRAMREIAESRDEQTIPKLMAILDAEDIGYRRAAVKTMGVIGPDAVPVLAESLTQHENPTVRASCAKALAQVAVNHKAVAFPDVGVQALRQAVNDPDPVVHLATVMALGAVGPDVFEILAETLTTTENPAIAVATVNALGSLGDPRCQAILEEFAQNDSVDPYIKESAVSALSRLEMLSKNQRP
ncbi:MAG: HEAT repeat domain-containing protein [Cyanobacteria bacterium P01_G01_bin.54]